MNTADAFQIGTPVSMIWYRAGEPQSFIGTVVSTEPFVLEAGDSSVVAIGENEPVKILFQNAGTFQAADAVVRRRTQVGQRQRLDLEQVKVEKSDRRSFPRHPATLLVKCRYVTDRLEGAEIREFMVTTRDISLGGTWVQSDGPMEQGAILNCEVLTAPGTTVRALGIVAWSDPNGNGFGVEFMDFIGGSRSALSSFIGGLAA